MHKAIFILPALAVCILIALQVMAFFETEHTIVLIDEPMPPFAAQVLNPLPGTPDTLTPDVLMQILEDTGHGVLVLNFFGTWCPACLIEHPQLITLAREYNLPVIGIAYRDTPEEIAPFLDRLGNPYRLIALDPDGEAAAYWNRRGTPESILIDSDGRIRLRFTGAIEQRDLTHTILPAIDAIRGEKAGMP